MPMRPTPRRHSFAPARELTPFRLFLLTGINARLRQPAFVQHPRDYGESRGYGGQAHIASRCRASVPARRSLGEGGSDARVRPQSHHPGNQA